MDCLENTGALELQHRRVKTIRVAKQLGKKSALESVIWLAGAEFAPCSTYGIIAPCECERVYRQQSGFESLVVLASIEANIHFLSAQIVHLEQQIQAHIDQDPALNQELQLLVSIVGIGPRSAVRILGELVHAADVKQADQVVAYAGLSIMHQESGHSVKRKQKLSKVGNAHLRTTLYFPAISGIRFNPIIKALVERSGKGKLPMEIIGAAMRKLLRLVFGVLKTRRHLILNLFQISTF